MKLGGVKYGAVPTRVVPENNFQHQAGSEILLKADLLPQTKRKSYIFEGAVRRLFSISRAKICKTTCSKKNLIYMQKKKRKFF
jgi:hypothetical protein